MKYFVEIIMCISYFTQVVNSATNCKTHKSCVSCTLATSSSPASSSKCAWCSTDKQCYTIGSTPNHCKQQQTISAPGLCYEKSPGRYSPDNGYINMLLSAVAYSRTPHICMDKLFPKGTFAVHERIHVKCDYGVIRYGKCYAYTAVSHEHSLIVVSFSGTQTPAQLLHIIWTLIRDNESSFKIGGKIQSYFKNVFERSIPIVKRSVKQLMTKYSKYSVVLNGHSLGGALASLTSISLNYDKITDPKRVSLYTYGMPRVGNTRFALRHDQLVKDSWRVVHYRDIAAHVPFCDALMGCSNETNAPFHSKTEVFYPEPRMSVDSSFKVCKENEDSHCSNGILSKYPCLFDMAECFRYHNFYFGVRVGLLCEKQLRYKDYNSSMALLSQALCK